jgi:hypothetical protein
MFSMIQIDLAEFFDNSVCGVIMYSFSYLRRNWARSVLNNFNFWILLFVFEWIVRIKIEMKLEKPFSNFHFFLENLIMIARVQIKLLENFWMWLTSWIGCSNQFVLVLFFDLDFWYELIVWI